MSIIILGDSNGQGFYDTEKGGWAERLKAYCFEHNDQFVFNLSVSGYSSNNLIELIERNELESRFEAGDEPHLIIVAVGLNDSVLVQDKRNLVSVSKYGENILQIFKHIVDWNKGNYDLTHRLLVVGPTSVDETRSTPVEWDDTLYYRNAEVKRYNEKLKEVCYPNNIRFLNLFDMASFDTCDGVHLSPAEHELIFNSVVKAVDAILHKIDS